MKSNELTIILENIQSLKNESNDIQAKNDNLENEISVSKALRETAELIKNNDRLDPLLLPVRDGVMIFRKKWLID